MNIPNVQKHMQAKAAAVSQKQGGANPEGGGGSKSSEVFDANRGSDKGGSNVPKGNPHKSGSMKDY